jgi:hypothetical protein
VAAIFYSIQLTSQFPNGYRAFLGQFFLQKSADFFQLHHESRSPKQDHSYSKFTTQCKISQGTSCCSSFQIVAFTELPKEWVFVAFWAFIRIYSSSSTAAVYGFNKLRERTARTNSSCQLNPLSSEWRRVGRLSSQLNH